jgi:TetR/AcrR family transcriptional regulator
MPQQRDLSRTHERIMAAALKEFAASGFAGARTDAIARRARVNERMIFYCFDSKEGLYRAVLKQKLCARAGVIESTPDEDLTSGMVKGFEAICADIDSLRMWQWEALDRSKRKLVAEEERRAYFRTEVARWRRAKAHGTLPPDADEEMLMLVSTALRTFPLTLPQVTSLVTGMDPLDAEFRRKWNACLEWIGQRIFAPNLVRSDEGERKEANETAGQNRDRNKRRLDVHGVKKKEMYLAGTPGDDA